jgi:hypothetical protein
VRDDLTHGHPHASTINGHDLCFAITLSQGASPLPSPRSPLCPERHDLDTPTLTQDTSLVHAAPKRMQPPACRRRLALPSMHTITSAHYDPRVIAILCGYGKELVCSQSYSTWVSICHEILKSADLRLTSESEGMLRWLEPSCASLPNRLLQTCRLTIFLSPSLLPLHAVKLESSLPTLSPLFPQVYQLPGRSVSGHGLSVPAPFCGHAHLFALGHHYLLQDLLAMRLLSTAGSRSHSPLHGLTYQLALSRCGRSAHWHCSTLRPHVDLEPAPYLKLFSSPSRAAETRNCALGQYTLKYWMYHVCPHRTAAMAHPTLALGCLTLRALDDGEDRKEECSDLALPDSVLPHAFYLIL